MTDTPGAVEAAPIALIGSEGNRIVGEVRGDGRRVALLVHGGGQTRHAWEKTARRLAASGVTAISIDQRGHGESAWSEAGDYQLTHYAADFTCVADQIADKFGDRPIAVGASLGGIAAMLAQGESDRSVLRALILVDVTPRMDTSGIARVTGFMAERLQEGFASLDEAAQTVADYLPHRVRPPSSEGLRKNLRLHEDGRYRWHWDPRLIDGPRPLTGQVRGSFQRLEAAAARLTLPVLLVRGGRSELVTMDHVAAFRQTVPHARFRDVSEAGHMVAGDKNDAFADAVIEFVEQLGE